MRIAAFTCNLGLEFTIASGVDVGEGRTSGDDALRIGDALGGTEDSQELIGLAPDATEDPKLLKNERPRNEREKKKKQENSAGHQACLLEDVKNVADDNGG